MRVLRGIRSKGFPRRQKPAAAPMAHAENTVAGEVPYHGPSLLALERSHCKLQSVGFGLEGKRRMGRTVAIL